jgi:hypothetical protein
MIKEVCQKINLIEHLKLELNIEMLDFFKKFDICVDEGEIGFGDGSFEQFSKSNNKYIGEVKFGSFKIRRKRKLFERYIYYPHLEGIYERDGDKTIIDITINGVHRNVKFTFVVIIIFMAILIPNIYSAILKKSNYASSFLFGILLVLCIFLIISILQLRSRVKAEKYDIERELYYIANKNKKF